MYAAMSAIAQAKPMTIPVAGIGASAGGLEAVKLLLARLPANTGLAFVFVQHLDPKHHSNLAEILARVSAIPVRQATDGMEIEPDHLYVIPPDVELEIVNQSLRMTPRAPIASGPHMPIDHFLRSLAQEYGSRAIGVLLSGAGTDGAAGLEAVKAAGGMTFAQEPTTARFGSMPKAAIEAGCVDLVLAPEAIAAELTKLGPHPYFTEEEAPEPALDEKDQFESILALLRETVGVDFALYRQDTIRRRILRRLALCNIGSLEEYRRQLESDSRELSTLHRDLLIGVTRFFRDPAMFESLKKLVFPHLVAHRPEDAAIRVWVPGCATGEEAYSIAISLQEYFEETRRSYPVQIFASDISSTAVDKARRGRYAGTIAADVSPARLNRYFSEFEGGYQISKLLREMCVFSKHDLLQDPPFSKLDLISCRNVLIFFGIVRRNIIARFHYALNPGGFLVLGPSERESGALFSVVEGAPSIYTKKEVAGKRHLLPAEAVGPRRSADVYKGATGIPPGELTNNIELRRELERTLLARYGRAGVVVDETLEVLEILGQTAPYLTLPAGKAGWNLFRLIPETRILLEVEKLVRAVEGSGKAARKDRVPYQSGGESAEVNVEVIPLGGTRARGLLVLFEPATRESGIERGPGPLQGDSEIATLKQDLAEARERLLSILEEHHSSEEESQNAAEEAISANEELQSLNEELETAKEELQSTNEELTTVNEELRSMNAALTEARDFAMLIIETSAAPLLVLDTGLRIKAANPAFYRAFRITPREAEGQFLYSVSSSCWDIPRLRDMLEHILPDHRAVQNFEIELEHPGVGHRALVLSARQLDGLEQVLLGIEDITERKTRAEATLHESEERFRIMADTAPVMIWVSGPDKARTFFSKGWLAFTGRTMDQELGTGWTEGVHPQDRECLSTSSHSLDARRNFQMECRLRRADGEYRWLLDTGVARFEQGGGFAGYVGSCVDITDLKRMQEENLAKQKLESVGTLAGGIAHDFNNLMGGVLAHSELALAELAGGGRPTEELQRIRSVAIRGAEIVRQLMIYAGQESEVLELVDVSSIVVDMLELLKVAVSKHAAVETALGKGLPLVRAHPAQLRQVAMNLIINASDAIGDQDGVIRVTTGLVTAGRDTSVSGAAELAEGDYVQFEVSDNGCGMTPETQARVFDPFFTTRLAGHGLGLAVVQGIVRGLRGTIRLVSSPGKGTTFQILLPCAKAPAPAAGSTISRAGEETLGTREATILATILVVEDEDSLREAVSKMLRKRGLSVVEAVDGTAALDRLRAGPERIDLLFLDFTLPGVSSREVVEEARRLRPGMTVLLTSAYSREMAAASLGASVDRFIRKPYRLDDVMDMIREILSS
jgi:two-component system CheB/CheR fusion protein